MLPVYDQELAGQVRYKREVSRMEQSNGNKQNDGNLQQGNLRGGRLQVNYLDAPLGVDGEEVRFSWQLTSPERGIAPAASQVRIATSEAALQAVRADVWNSGKRRGSAQYMDYTGPTLRGRSRFWWQVSVWDSTGQRTISDPAYFDTGLCAQDWQAEWIWRSGEVVVNDFAYLRKAIEVKGPAAYAKIFVSAHNTMQLFLNGQRIGGWGTPAPTNPQKTKYYAAYDVTTMLMNGENTLAAAAHYLGGGGQNYVDGKPGFRLQLEVDYADGTSQTFKSDSSWQSLVQMPHTVGTPYQQRRRISAIEQVDARIAGSDWLYPGYAGDNCTPAVAGGIGCDAYPMKWQPLPEGRIETYMVPTKLSSPEASDAQLFDAGRVVSGWPSITLPGIAGLTVRLRYSEDLDEQGLVKHNVCNEQSEHYYDEYTMRGDEREAWQPDFSYKAFRYVEVNGYPDPIIPGEHLRIASAHTALEQVGRFRSSDQLLNDMYDACIRTQTNNALGQLTDCPHREQAQYLADSDLQAETLLYNFDAGYHAVEKVLSDFADGQSEEGVFPFVYPSNMDDPDFAIQIPEWDLHFCTLLWKLYESSGDKRLLARYYEPARRMVDYYLGIIHPAIGLAPVEKGWHISDWPYPEVDHSSAYLTVQNIKLYKAAAVVAKLAAKTGRKQEGKAYQAAANRLRVQINRRLFNKKQGKYLDCLGSEHMHQGVNALAVHYGVAREPMHAALASYAAASVWESRTVLSLPLLRMLFEHGHAQAAYRLINRKEYPGWGYMISQGARTMWEGWDDIESHSHAWNGYPARLLQEYVAGIRPVTPGYAKVEIRPYMPEGLSFAEAEITTPFGNLAAGWARDEEQGTTSIVVRLPVGVQANLIVALPAAVGKDGKIVVKESGNLLCSGERSGDEHCNEGAAGSVAGVVHYEQTATELVIGLTHGRYRFVLGAAMAD
ncbi:alpha-L-rhamnosidase [Paenibacillaceae bacterium]|nr:alpha-L-rhamnosidase [Paenibacillaceae bacterium]